MEEFLKCEVCEEKLAQIKYRDCNPTKYLCDTCSGFTHQSDAKKAHHIEILDYEDSKIVNVTRACKEYLTRCEKHLDEKCKAYCQNCQKPICSYCINSNHQKHNWIDLVVKKGEIEKLI